MQLLHKILELRFKMLASLFFLTHDGVVVLSKGVLITLVFAVSLFFQ